MNVHLEALTKGCHISARKLMGGPWISEFYLAGGTALALYYGHRISADLDFFSESSDLSFANRQTPIKNLISMGATIEEETDGTIKANLMNTHLRFMAYSYPLLKPCRKWERLRVGHPIDIGLMKIGAIIGRGSKKDFYDLYEILNREIPLPKLLKLGKKKFASVSDFTVQSLRALVYFTDADKEPEPRKLNDQVWPTIKKYFEEEVRKLGKKWI